MPEIHSLAHSFHFARALAKIRWKSLREYVVRESFLAQLLVDRGGGVPVALQVQACSSYLCLGGSIGVLRTPRPGKSINHSGMKLMTRSDSHREGPRQLQRPVYDKGANAVSQYFGVLSHTSDRSQVGLALTVHFKHVLCVHTRVYLQVVSFSILGQVT